MNEFLLELGNNIQAGKHAAVIIDNAGWHKSHELEIPENITLIPLPPYSPELNAVEQVWEWLVILPFLKQSKSIDSLQLK
jgi:transposase